MGFPHKMKRIGKHTKNPLNHSKWVKNGKDTPL
jgi:hypothetical protein